MRAAVAFLALGLVLVAVVVGMPGRPSSPEVGVAASAPKPGDPVPEFSLPGLDGKPVTIPKGKVVLINFWATWCPPCRMETPSMVDLYRKLRERGLEILAVSVDKSDADVEKFVREYGIPYPVLRDPDARIAHAFGVFKYPETFIVDRRGIVRHHVIGAINWMDPTAVRALEELLDARG